MGTRGVSRGRRNRYAQFGLDRTRSRRPTTSKLCHPIPERKAKQSYESSMDHISSFYGAYQPAAQPFKREPSWAKRGPSFSRQRTLPRQTAERPFLVRAIDRGLEASRPQELSSR